MHHVLYNETEMMKLLQRDPQTLVVLKSLQTWYETRCRRKLLEEGGCELDGIKAIEKQELLDLLKETQQWMSPKNARANLSKKRSKL